MSHENQKLDAQKKKDQAIKATKSLKNILGGEEEQK